MNSVTVFSVETEFTNNILTVMRALNSRGDRKLLETVISDYSAVLHYMQKSSEPFCSTAVEFEVCGSFLRLQQIRYGKRLHYSLPDSDQPCEHTVKKFSVLSVVSEAVDYIAEQSFEGGCIRVECADVIRVFLKTDADHATSIIEYEPVDSINPAS